jgi:hypothetical protein
MQKGGLLIALSILNAIIEFFNKVRLERAKLEGKEEAKAEAATTAQEKQDAMASVAERPSTDAVRDSLHTGRF